MSTPFSIDEVSFRDLPGWREDNPSKLFAAMGTILSHLRNAKPYRTGALGVTPLGATQGTLKHYRRKVAANNKRLTGKRAPRR